MSQQQSSAALEDEIVAGARCDLLGDVAHQIDVTLLLRDERLRLERIVIKVAFR